MAKKHSNDDTQWIVDSDGQLVPPPVGICQCGCGLFTAKNKESHPSRGVIKGEYKRFARGHRIALVDRFEVDERTGCWNWLLAVDKGGYGDVSRPPYRSAHRWFYEMIVGPIDEGLDLDHTCRNRRCVNPQHLEPVPTVVNVRRGLGTTLSEEQAREAVSLIGTTPYTEIARLLGVSKSAIVHLANGRTWPELNGKEVPRQTGRWTIRGKTRTSTSSVLTAA